MINNRFLGWYIQYLAVATQIMLFGTLLFASYSAMRFFDFSEGAALLLSFALMQSLPFLFLTLHRKLTKGKRGLTEKELLARNKEVLMAQQAERMRAQNEHYSYRNQTNHKHK